MPATTSAVHAAAGAPDGGGKRREVVAGGGAEAYGIDDGDADVYEESTMPSRRKLGLGGYLALVAAVSG